MAELEKNTLEKLNENPTPATVVTANSGNESTTASTDVATAASPSATDTTADTSVIAGTSATDSTDVTASTAGTSNVNTATSPSIEGEKTNTEPAQQTAAEQQTTQTAEQQATSEQTSKSTPQTASVPVYTSYMQATASKKQGSHFFSKLLFLLVGLVVLPLCLTFALTGVSLILTTLVLFFTCFALLGSIFFPNLLTLCHINLPDKWLSLEAIPYLQQYYELIPEPYKFVLASVLVFLIALLVLAFGFLFLNLTKWLWRSMGKWRRKLSK